jgi:transcriptional regulator with XRE-family HTH domain
MPDRIYCLPEKLLPSTVGPVLRDYRLMSQFGRAQLAAMLDIKPDTLTRWELQRTALRSDQMIKFANAIDLEVVLFDRFEFRQLYGDHLERQEKRLHALSDSVNRRG